MLLSATLAGMIAVAACSDTEGGGSAPSAGSAGAGDGAGAESGDTFSTIAGGEGGAGEGGAGRAQGGAPTQGGNAGTSAKGGTASGAAGVLSTPEGGAGGGADGEPFFLGADISSTQESSLVYRDVDGTEKPLLEVLKSHGFNYARLRTFVEPSAPYGYASDANGCTGRAESFGDRDHVIAYGQQIKQAGMGFLLDFHYSDVWADPGKQIIPEAWRSAASVSELASLMKAYTRDVIEKAIAAGARPDMVQIGNEITGGLLKDLPGPKTDCWGNNPVSAPFGGGTAQWDNLATLLKAGISAVREVDPTIQIMLHIENTDDLGGVRWWLDNALARDVSFDVLGFSCYVAFQGQPSTWKTTFNDLAVRYPTLKLAIAEYNEERAQANLMVRALPKGRGLGTFFWEPTQSGTWGSALFDVQDDTATAIQSEFAELDQLRPQLGL